MVKEEEIESALRSRIQHFKENSDSFTLESVRRLLEKDLGLEKYALDVHKKFVQASLYKHMEADDEDGSKGSAEEKETYSTKKDVELPQKLATNQDIKESCSEGDVKKDDSPIMGLMTVKSRSNKGQVTETSESTIRKAIQDRASHFIANSETITMTGARRLLEEDLGLDKNSLEPYKKFICNEIDKVLKVPTDSKSASDTIKEKTSKISRSKASGKIRRNGSSDSLDILTDEVDDKKESRKQVASRGKTEKSGPEKRKRPNKEASMSTKKQNKLVKKQEENSDSDIKSASEDDQSQSSTEKLVKKKETATPGYGKRVERLKSIIKACGMSVAPTVYKKAKQVSDDNREAFLIKELEGILSREGLSTNPTEKEIKEVKKRKERARELEGIDLSNIVSSSRRRSTSSFMAPPKPKARDGDGNKDVKDFKRENSGSDGGEKPDREQEEEGEDSEEEEEDDDDDNEEDEEEEEGSQSEEFEDQVEESD